MLSVKFGDGLVAMLTAHLSEKDGNELDIFVADENGEPVALALRTFSAKVNNETVTFTAAPADERPEGEPADQCSHYVAKTPFLVPSDTYTVTVSAYSMQGDKLDVVWKNFLPSKYAHNHD